VLCALLLLLLLLQLVIGDSPLNLALQSMNISGTFQMGTAACPIKSLVNVFIPGGTSTFGIFAMRDASFDVHGAFTVSTTPCCGQLTGSGNSSNNSWLLDMAGCANCAVVLVQKA
jgi:hypothetical protein